VQGDAGLVGPKLEVIGDSVFFVPGAAEAAYPAGLSNGENLLTTSPYDQLKISVMLMGEPHSGHARYKRMAALTGGYYNETSITSIDQLGQAELFQLMNATRSARPEQEEILSQAKVVSQPTGINACEGAEASLLFNVIGKEPSYTWYKNEVTLGRNHDTLNLSPLRASDIGAYFCKVSNGDTVIYSDTVQVDVKASQQEELQVNICQGESYSFDGEALDSSGVYVAEFLSATGCDSTVELTLTVYPSYQLTLTETICQGDSLLLGESYYKTAGQYTDTLTSLQGCDSVVQVSLSLAPVYDTVITRTICPDDSLVYEGEVLKSAGDYTFDWQSSESCDSTVVLRLSHSNDLCEPSSVTLVDEARVLSKPVVSPNPTDGYLMIDISSGVARGVYQLYSLGGQRLTAGRYAAGTKLDLSSLPSAVYLLQLISDEGEIFHYRIEKN